jgi:hypothetical protein
MPNWVKNHMLVTGTNEDVTLFIKEIAEPFRYKTVESFSDVPVEQESRLVLNFFNVIAPSDDIMDAYAQQPARGVIPVTDPNWWSEQSKIMEEDNSWYNWNVRNWGTKWNAVGPEFVYQTKTDPTRTRVLYKFDTAWDYPSHVYVAMAKKWHTLNFYIRAEEETGWGVVLQYKKGENTYYKSVDPVPNNFLEKLVKNG